MTEPTYTAATVFTWGITEEQYEQNMILLNELRNQHLDLRSRSILISNVHPTYVRHWYTIEDAQFWLEQLVEFANLHELSLEARVEPINS